METENHICSLSPALVMRRHWRVLVLCFAAGFQPLLLEPMLRFHHSLHKVALREEEYVLMQAMSLFSPGSRKPSPLRPTLLLMIHPLCKYSNPAKLQVRLNKYFFFVRVAWLRMSACCVYFILPDRQGVQGYSAIDRLHENLALTLKTSIECQRSGPEKRWALISPRSRIGKKKHLAPNDVICLCFPAAWCFPKWLPASPSWERSRRSTASRSCRSRTLSRTLSLLS